MKKILKQLFIITALFYVVQYDAGYPVIKNKVSEWYADNIRLGHCGAINLTIGKKHILLKSGNFEYEKMEDKEVEEHFSEQIRKFREEGIID